MFEALVANAGSFSPRGRAWSLCIAAMATGGNTVQIILNFYIAHDGQIAHIAGGPSAPGVPPPVYITDMGDIVRRGVPAALPPPPPGVAPPVVAPPAAPVVRPPADPVVAPPAAPVVRPAADPAVAPLADDAVVAPLPCRHQSVIARVKIVPFWGRPGPVFGNCVRSHVRSAASWRNGPGAGRPGRSSDGECSSSIQLPLLQVTFAVNGRFHRRQCNHCSARQSALCGLRFGPW